MIGHTTKPQLSVLTHLTVCSVNVLGPKTKLTSRLLFYPSGASSLLPHYNFFSWAIFL